MLVEAEYGTAANAASRFIREHIFLDTNVKLVRQIWADTRAMKTDIELLMRGMESQNNFPAYSSLSNILTKTELQLDRIGRILEDMTEEGGCDGDHEDHEYR